MKANLITASLVFLVCACANQVGSDFHPGVGDAPAVFAIKAPQSTLVQ